MYPPAQDENELYNPRVFQCLVGTLHFQQLETEWQVSGERLGQVICLDQQNARTDELLSRFPFWLSGAVSPHSRSGPQQGSVRFNCYMFYQLRIEALSEIYPLSLCECQGWEF
ncbi:hypothetical protein DPEC_G00137260 [Dallia pectoralis]|uniref:Uncharacterized protein n=1 Tax=Dallia pectoralis TaxID=75939 RepID=A0ACC2GLP6_DALPE|nr:hypothetical protein DPEC_G00137260 [Dallia pectoralis]